MALFFVFLAVAYFEAGAAVRSSPSFVVPPSPATAGPERRGT